MSFSTFISFDHLTPILPPNPNETERLARKREDFSNLVLMYCPADRGLWVSYAFGHARLASLITTCNRRSKNVPIKNRWLVICSNFSLLNVRPKKTYTI